MCWTNAGTTADLHFATMVTDQGLDYTLNRRYSPTEGRWLSPDPVRGDIQNPQTLNLYPSVADNPANRTDPQGKQFCAP